MDRVYFKSKFVDEHKEIMLIELGGHIDQSNTYQLQKIFDDIIESGCFKVVVDLNRLEYMSSAGWGVFVGQIKRFRDNGGDIKLAEMNSDIYDVFQMLEFYHIIEDYTHVNEAINSFADGSSDLHLVQEPSVEKEDTKNSGKEKSRKQEDAVDKDTIAISSKQEIIEFIPGKSKWNEIYAEEKEIIEQKLEKTVNLKELPLPQKIRTIVSENPILGMWGIKKKLQSNHYGNTKVNFIKLLFVLIELDLNSKEKRYRYYRSC